MAGRGRMPRQPFDDGRRGFLDGPFAHGPPRGHPAQLEEEIEIRNADIRRLIADNRRLSEDREILQRELASARDEIHRLNFVIKDIQAEREAMVRDMLEKGLKLEADLRATDPLRSEVMVLRAEIQKFGSVKEELSGQVKNLSHELARAQADNKQVPVMRAEIEGMRQEIMHARTALEYEKKANAELFEQRQSVEKNLISMAREIEKLRAEGARGATGVGGPYVGSAERTFPTAYGDGYGLQLGVADKAPLYGATSGSWGAYDKSHIARR